MTPETVAIVGLVVTIAAVGLRQEQLRRRGNGNSSSDSAKQIAELHLWHSQEDPAHPGAKLWWGLGILTLQEDVLKLRKEVTEQHSELLEAFKAFRDSWPK